MSNKERIEKKTKSHYLQPNIHLDVNLVDKLSNIHHLILLSIPLLQPLQTNLRMHNANVHADDQNRTTYPCDEPTCDKSFTARRNMRSHWHLKHAPLQDRQFVCDRCSLPLSGKRKLELHIEWHERNPDAKIRPLRVSTHLCEVPFCGRKYVRRQALVEHYRKAHPDEAVPESPVQRPTVAERLAGVRDGGEEGEEEEVEEEETEETEEVGGDKAKAGDDDDLLSGT